MSLAKAIILDLTHAITSGDDSIGLVAVWLTPSRELGGRAATQPMLQAASRTRRIRAFLRPGGAERGAAIRCPDATDLSLLALAAACYVGPYQEAQQRLSGRTQPDFIARACNRLWAPIEANRTHIGRINEPINVIFPYKHGMWVFDDSRVGRCKSRSWLAPIR
jgi:hypothetical protein